jgi:hypothetical protein
MSPDPDSGKTTLLGVLHWLVFNANSSIDPSNASVLRAIDESQPTIIVDEVNRLFKRRPDLLEIFLAGWTNDDRKVTRVIGGVLCKLAFFCPKIIGGIGMKGLDPGLLSRCIELLLLPAREDEPVEEFDYTDRPEFVDLRRKAARLVTDHSSAIKGLKPTMPDGFSNRLRANYKLLFQIAEFAGGVWPKRAKDAAIFIASRAHEISLNKQLLEGIRLVFGGRAEVTSDEVVTGLLADPEAIWHVANRGRPITKWWVAAQLKDAFRIEPGVIHPTKRSNSSPRGYKREHFEDLWVRYRISDPPDPN